MFTKISQILRRYKPFHKPKAFKLFQVESALLCNLRCIMCPWTQLSKKAQETQCGLMDMMTYSRISTYMPEVHTVDLCGGGEPLLNPHIFEMVRIAKAKGCKVGFSSNGTLWTKEATEELVRSGLDFVAFSMDGATSGIYQAIRKGANFNKVIENIAYLKDLKEKLGREKPRVSLVYVMMKENIHELAQFIDLAYHLGGREVIAKNLDVVLKAQDDHRRLFSCDGVPVGEEVKRCIQEARKRAQKKGISLKLYAFEPEELVYCEQEPLRSIFFTWDGEVSPCITK